MNLRTLAEQDLGKILENDSDGFGWPIRITDPTGVFADLVGMSGDIATSVDRETGAVISGRFPVCSVRVSTLYEKGLTIPYGVANKAAKPWIVEFTDINGVAYTFKVKQSEPDRTLGYVNLILEFYDAS